MQNPDLRRWIRSAHTLFTAGAVLCGALAISPSGHAAEDLVRLPGHVPAITASSALVGHVTRTQPIPLAIALPLRNRTELKDLIRRLYDKQDPQYGRYLTPSEFADRFGATREDYAAVIAFAKSKGLAVTGTHPNRLLVDVSGKPADVEAAFGLRLNTYREADGTTYFAPDAGPALPKSVAGKVESIFGLSSAARPLDFAQVLKRVASADALRGGRTAEPLELTRRTKTGDNVGTAFGYLGPKDIQRIYNLDDGVYNGDGQSVALFEIGGYYAYDIAKYEKHFHLHSPPIDIIPVDGFDESPTAGYDAEIDLDIDSVLASAPGISTIDVYEAPPGDGSIAGIAPGWLDELSKIATDDKASQVSMSYGLAEDTWEYYEGVDFILNEDTYFQEMAAQGQSVYVASGDRGAYQDGATLSVSSPASDPYVTAVGGTSLTTDANYDYLSETTWNDLQYVYMGMTYNEGAGGGGISSFWAETPWQLPFINAANMGSTVARNVPDVSLVADPNTGFVIYQTDGFDGPGFYVYGGTSLATPLWAGFNAKVNEAREQAGIGPVGFVAPSLYGIASTGAYATDFHDIADGSTNGNTTLFPGLPGYPAVPGYDLATGLGSYVGVNLLEDLTGYASSYAPPLNPANVVAGSGDGYVDLTWNKSVGAKSYLIYRYPGPGGYFQIVGSSQIPAYWDATVKNGTTYEYVVSAVGLGGQSDYTNAPAVFGTPARVRLAASPVALPAATGSETVNWQTNVLSDATIGFGTTEADALNHGVSDHQLLTNHTLTLPGLTPGVKYYYFLADFDGKVTFISKFYTFTAH